MKLLSLHIDGFGKLVDLKYDFSDKLNVIEADNGFGKTTLAAFIKAMLYGLQSPNTRGKVTNNDRAHYSPWGGGPYGGSLDLETAKGRFRITRRFGSKSSSDDFSLTDLNTGLPSRAYSENIGAELFGLDASSYEKSTYVPQTETEVTMSSDINAKLTGLLQSSDDMSEYDNAIARLDDHMRRFKLLTGDKGLIQDTRREYDECLAVISECERALEISERCAVELKALADEDAALNVKIRELQAEIDEANLKKLIRTEFLVWRDYSRKAAERREQLAKLKEQFKKGVPDASVLGELSLLCTKYETAIASPISMSYADASELEALAERFGDEPVSRDERRRLSDEWNALKATKPSETPVAPEPYKPRSRPILLPISIVGLLVGAALTVAGALLPMLILLIAGSVVAVASVALLFLSFAQKKQDREGQELFELQMSDYRETLARISKEASEYARRREILEASLKHYYPEQNGEPDALLYRLEADSTRYALLISARERFAAEADARRHANQDLLDRIHNILEGYGVVCNDQPRVLIDRLRNSLRDLDDAKSRLAEAEKQASDYKAEKNIGDEPPLPPDTDELSARMNALLARSGEIQRRIGVLTESKKSTEERAERLPALRDRAESLSVLIEDYKTRRATAERAKELLSAAKSRLSSRYLRDMEIGFSSNFSELTGRDAPETLIAADLGINFREIGGQRDIAWYSAGQRAAISVCLRLALIDAIFTEERPFLVLDDPFTDLDAKTMQNAAEMLKTLSEKMQIVYFTCHKSRNIN